MDSLFTSCLNPARQSTPDKNGLISLQEYTPVQPRNSDMGGDGWNLFRLFGGGSEPEAKGGKNKGGHVCSDHAMMYQMELRNRDVSSDEETGDIVPHAEGYTPNVTMNTKRRLLDEFNTLMAGNSGAAELLKKMASSHEVGHVDTTNVRWINTLFRLVWPRMSKVIQKAMDELVEPAVREAVPQIKGSFELFTDMGSTPPTLGPMKTFKDDDTSISLDVGITWDADLQVTVEASVLTIIVDQLKLQGTMIVKLCPLLDEIPMIGALHIYFLDPPDLDMRIRIKRSPLKLSNTINREIDKGMRDALVLPNRILAPVAQMHQMKSMRLLHNPPPVGLLKLTVLEMRNLPAADQSIIGKPTSDPFAEVRIGAQSWKSGVVSSTLNPVFKKDNSHNFWFFTDRQNVHMSVWDFDKASGNDVLGDVVDLTVDVLEGENWFDMELAEEFRNRDADDEKAGGGGCFKSLRRDATEKKKKKAKSEADSTQDIPSGPQVLLRGSIHRLSDRVKYVKQNVEFILEVSVVGIRKAKGQKVSCDGASLGCTFEGDTRLAPPCFPNHYADPTFLEKNINPATVHRLAQMHSEKQVAQILDIKVEQVQASQRAGHEGIWCHSFFFQSKNPNGEVSFAVFQAKGKKFEQKLTFEELKTPDGAMACTYPDFEIGPFYIDVTIRLSAIIPSTLD